MAEESFTSAVEKALKSGQLSPKEAEIAKQQAQLSPNERKIKRGTNLKKIKNTTPKSGVVTKTGNTGLTIIKNEATQAGMRNAGRGKGITVADDILKLTGKSAKNLGRFAKLLPMGGMVGRASVPVALAIEAYKTGELALSKDARDEAAQDYIDSANENALMRTIKGGLGGVTTIYGAGSAIGDMLDTQERAYKSERALEKQQMDPNKQELVESARERQAIYMSLPQEERDLVDSMSGKEAKQYLLDKKTKLREPLQKAPMRETKSPSETMAAPASSEPAPPSSPATAGAQKSPMERQTTAMDAAIAAAPKAIPVAEPVKVDMDRAMELFQNTHGGPFDPKSSMDRGKMAVIQDLMSRKGSEKLTPNQFSLQIYRMSK